MSHDEVDYYSLEGGRKSPDSEALYRKEIRHGFIRKVYGIVSTQLLLTTVVTSLLLFVPGGREWAQRGSTAVVVICSIILFSAMLALTCCRAALSYPTNYILLLFFTLAEAMLVGVVTAFYSVPSVAIALGATVIIAVSLTLFAYQTKYDFTSCMAVLFIASLNLLLFGILAALLGSWAEALYSALALVIFSFYLVVDTQLIIARGTLKLDEDDYIIAAIMIYIDLINIFLSLLRLFGQRDNS